VVKNNLITENKEKDSEIKHMKDKNKQVYSGTYKIEKTTGGGEYSTPGYMLSYSQYEKIRSTGSKQHK